MKTPLLALSEPSQAPAPNQLPVTSGTPSVPPPDNTSTLRKSPSREIPDASQQKSSVESASKKLDAPAVVQQRPAGPPVSSQSETVTNPLSTVRNYSNLQNAKNVTDSATKEAASTQNAGAQAKTTAQIPAPAAATPPGAAMAAPGINEALGPVDKTRASGDEKLVQPRAATSASPLKSPAVGGIAQKAEQNSGQRSQEILIGTPEPKVLWRIAGAGFVERTTDGGATWHGQLPDPDLQFTAGSSPGTKVCWLVGRSGAIVLTKDATKWKKIPPPVPADFTAVTAKNASDATVTTADGQKFSTSDGGKKWKPAQ
jgi:hypothetical protein